MMEETKLEKAQELQEVEQMKHNFNKQLEAVESHYFIKGKVYLDIDTSDYVRKGTDEGITFTTELMKKYIEEEIEHLTDRSNKLLKEMIDM